MLELYCLKCPSASVVVTSTFKINTESYSEIVAFGCYSLSVILLNICVSYFTGTAAILTWNAECTTTRS